MTYHCLAHWLGGHHASDQCTIQAIGKSFHWSEPVSLYFHLQTYQLITCEINYYTQLLQYFYRSFDYFSCEFQLQFLLFVYVLEVLVFTQQNLFPRLPRTLFHPPNPLFIMISNKCFILLFQSCVLISQFLLLSYHLLESPFSISSILL